METTPRLLAAIGTFDGVHTGHRHLLGLLTTEARTRGLAPAVVTFTNHPLEVIRPERVPPTLTPYPQKEALLKALGVSVIPMKFDEELRRLTASEFMTMLRERHGVDALVLGYDTRFGHDRPQSFDDYAAIAASAGMQVILASALTDTADALPVSSTRIRAAIAAGDITTADSLLGRPYEISGTVVHGRAIGRTIGFPTANVAPDCPGQLMPPNGVYAVAATLPSGVTMPAVANIGLRPTVDPSAAPERTLEVHIPGYSGDLYGKHISVGFLRRIRPERRFAGLDELKGAIAADIASLNR